MDIDDVILLILAASDSKINGKTVMQKICYFVSVRLEKNMGYFAHYYGPYSREVDHNIINLKAFGFINEQVIYTNNWRRMSRYSLSDDGKKIVQNLKEKNHDDYDVIKEVVDTCLSEGEDYEYLSYAAKVYFTMPERPVTNKEIIKLAEEYDWKITESQIERVEELLEKLDLIYYE